MQALIASEIWTPGVVSLIVVGVLFTVGWYGLWRGDRDQ